MTIHRLSERRAPADMVDVLARRLARLEAEMALQDEVAEHWEAEAVRLHREAQKAREGAFWRYLGMGLAIGVGISLVLQLLRLAS